MTPLLTPSMDESARLLAERLRAKIPTTFVRVGDGALEAIAGRPGQTCDGERYTGELAEQLLLAIKALQASPDVLWGDWATATNGSAPNHVSTWQSIIAPPPDKLLHFEALLLNRRSDALLDFYRAVRDDPRRKLIIGAEWNEAAGPLLHANYIAVPARNLLSFRALLNSRMRSSAYEMLLFGAGLAGLVIATDQWILHPERTYIHLGSAFDPLYKGRTRGGQLSTYQAREWMNKL